MGGKEPSKTEQRNWAGYRKGPTGRHSVGRPEFQNITPPRTEGGDKIRKAFIPEIKTCGDWVFFALGDRRLTCTMEPHEGPHSAEGFSWYRGHIWIEPSPEKKLTRAATIARMEAQGDLDPDCSGCRERYAAEDPAMVFAPHHKASVSCQSGKHNHCTCDTCF